jgi:hypothetical protein
MTAHPSLPPESVEAVSAELMLAVYTARRRARRQLLGHDPIPTPSQAALEMWRDEKARELRRPRLQVVKP